MKALGSPVVLPAYCPSTVVHTFKEDDFGEDLLGEGTASIVYRVDWNALPVALKILKPQEQIAEPWLRERAEADLDNEILVNSRLRHPNILLFIGVCNSESGRRGLLFELAQGGRLDVKRFGPSRVLPGLAIATGVARALSYAHSLRIMHRDIKPSQVLMSCCGMPKLGDWGLAKVVKDSADARGTGETGTWEFVMAPEVIRHEKYGFGADVFSFGVLVWTILSGTSYPYASLYLTPAQAAMGVAHKDLRPKMVRSVDVRLQELIADCWASESSARPSMDEVVRRLITATEVEAERTKLATNGSSTGVLAWLRG